PGWRSATSTCRRWAGRRAWRNPNAWPATRRSRLRRGPVRRRARVGAGRDAHQADAVPVDGFGLEPEAVGLHALADLRHVPELAEHEAAHAVPVVVGQLGAEELVQL